VGGAAVEPGPVFGGSNGPAGDFDELVGDRQEEPMHLALFILIGLIAGALAGRVVSGHGYGVLGDIVVGGLGAFLGGWMFATFMGVAGSGFIMSLFVAFIGAVILLWLIRLVAARHA
jgi:uncharacterized membrane protein YeaQ/YmgE (transglycosylase-associated protein family)